MTDLKKRLKALELKLNIDMSKESKLTQEIVEAVLEVKLMREGKIKPLSIKDI